MLTHRLLRLWRQPPVRASSPICLTPIRSARHAVPHLSKRKRLQFLKQKKGWSPEKAIQADDLGPMVASLKIFQKYYIKIEQSLLERFFNFILWDFERSDNIQSKVKQYLQKIAQMRRKSIRPQVYQNSDELYFPHAVRFSAAYWRQHIFRPSLRYWSERRGHFHQNKTKLCGLNRLHRLSAWPVKIIRWICWICREKRTRRFFCVSFFYPWRGSFSLFFFLLPYLIDPRNSFCSLTLI